MKIQNTMFWWKEQLYSTYLTVKNWNLQSSPGKSGRPRLSSARIQPTDHTSAEKFELENDISENN